MSANKVLMEKPSFEDYQTRLLGMFSEHMDLNLSKTTLIQKIYSEFFQPMACIHEWKVAGVSSHINQIDEISTDKYTPHEYHKKEAVVVTSLYCPKCGEINSKKCYT